MSVVELMQRDGIMPVIGVRRRNRQMRRTGEGGGGDGKGGGEEGGERGGVGKWSRNHQKKKIGLFIELY